MNVGKLTLAEIERGVRNVDAAFKVSCINGHVLLSVDGEAWSLRNV